ncbi:MAG: hypothetical protein K2X53_05405 [Alphaproteobacteria bacterium]|nr:hypothetical protein [Alphaproteobacteria bacterium]
MSQLLELEIPKALEKRLEEVARLMNKSIDDVATLAVQLYLEENADRLIEEAALKKKI